MDSQMFLKNLSLCLEPCHGFPDLPEKPKNLSLCLGSCHKFPDVPEDPQPVFGVMPWIPKFS